MYFVNGSASGLNRAGRYASLWLGLTLVHPVVAQETVDKTNHPSAAATQSTAEVNPKFSIYEFRVKGNRLLAVKEIELTVYPFLGEDKTIDDVEAARRALESRYRDAGYGTVLIDIPEQDVVGNVVRLDVTEGKVGRVRVTGSRYFSLGRIRDRVPEFASGKVPHIPTAQEQLTQVNRMSSDRSVTPVLRAGKLPGTFDVDLKVNDELPLHGDLELNDRNIDTTSRTRLTATLRYNNLWQLEHSASFSFQISPQDPSEVQVYTGTYLFRVPGTESSLALYALKSASDIAALGTLAVIGDGSICGARWILPLAPLTEYFHSATFGIDYKDFGESLVLRGGDSFNTPIDYMVLSALYDVTALQGENRTRFTAGINVGINGLLNDEDEFEQKRFKAEPDFAYLHVAFEHNYNWFYASRLVARLNGQLAAAPLVSNEQFSAGGMQSVRGYFESQALADDGIDGQFEIHSPSFGHYLWEPLSELRLFAFVDAAKLRLKDPLSAQTADFSLLSAGIGLNLTASRQLSAALISAHPFSKIGSVDPGENRVHFRVSYDF